jgi:uncharacterized protein YdeI (BOF family)
MKTIALILVMALAAPLALSACDRTVEEQTKTKTNSNGSTQIEQKKTTESPNGDVTVTKEKKTVDNNP